MPKSSSNEDHTLLSMALVGYESEKQKLEEKIEELRARLSGGVRNRPGRPAKKAAGRPASSDASEEGGRKRRTLSAAARKRIAAAQKKRWAEHRKRVAAE